MKTQPSFLSFLTSLLILFVLFAGVQSKIEDFAELEALEEIDSFQGLEDIEEENEVDELMMLYAKKKSNKKTTAGTAAGTLEDGPECSRAGLQQPAQLINQVCVKTTAPGICSPECNDALCNVIRIFRTCRTEVQASVDLLESSINDELNRNCNHILKCIAAKTKKKKSSSGFMLQPNFFSTAFFVTFITCLALFQIYF